MDSDILTLGDALNYIGGVGAVIGFMVLIAVVSMRVVDAVGRSRCRYRHPASVGRRARIVAQRRARLDRRGVIK